MIVLWTYYLFFLFLKSMLILNYVHWEILKTVTMQNKWESLRPQLSISTTFYWGKKETKANSRFGTEIWKMRYEQGFY